MTSFKYSVDLELRYVDAPSDCDERAKQVSKTITIGIYDTYEEAVKAGNYMLETELESRFPLNKNWNKTNRFGETYTKYLISDLAYLTTPFSFFAHINRLQLSPVSEAIEAALSAENRYLEWKKASQD